MKTGLSINPLLLSIMAQAAEIVKSETSFIPSSEVGESGVPFSEDFIIADHTKILTLDPNILKHPLLNKNGRSNTQAYTFSKGLKADVLEGPESVQKMLKSSAVRVDWNPQWKSLPSWVVEYLIDPQRTSTVWMHVKYEDMKFLTEKWCHQSIQLGWAWWLSPPKTASELKEFFDVSKVFWKFWFTHPKSDQWVWPWCNILLKECVVNSYKGAPITRPWATDARNKNVWLQIENEAWQSLLLVVGGENLLKGLSASVYEWVLAHGIAPE